MFWDYCGITRIGRHLGYGSGFGRLRWLPMWAKRLIVKVHNNIVCLVSGHDTFGPYQDEDVSIPKTCMHCSKRWP